MVHSYPATSDKYYAVRDLSPSTLQPVERASRFIYLNRFCFNGIYRTNRDGRFNVPMGRSTGNVPSEAAFVRCAHALRMAKLVSADFSQTLRTVEPNDFVYVDPPYATSRATYGEYGYGAFSGGDLAALVTELRRLDDLGAKVLLSYRHDDELLRALPDWKRRPVTVRRDVAGAPRNRSDAVELLMWNKRLNSSVSPTARNSFALDPC